jgi:hypothetical protein
MGEASGDDEFRPFVRRLPEWQFWCVSHPPPTNILTLTTQQQALLDTCNDNSTPMHHIRDLRRTSLLAHPRLLFLRFVRIDYEEADSASFFLSFSFCFLSAFPPCLRSPMSHDFNANESPSLSEQTYDQI